jgi:hypothetical protein
MEIEMLKYTGIYSFSAMQRQEYTKVIKWQELLLAILCIMHNKIRTVF